MRGKSHLICCPQKEETRCRDLKRVLKTIMSSDPMMISTVQVLIIATDCLDDELGDREEALEGDAEILGAEHAVTAGREEGGQ